MECAKHIQQSQGTRIGNTSSWSRYSCCLPAGNVLKNQHESASGKLLHIQKRSLQAWWRCGDRCSSRYTSQTSADLQHRSHWKHFNWNPAGPKTSHDYVCVQPAADYVCVQRLRQPSGHFINDLSLLTNNSNETLLLGDFNAKHTEWKCTTSNSTGKYLHEYIQTSEYTIIAPDTHTLPTLRSLTVNNRLAHI